MKKRINFRDVYKMLFLTVLIHIGDGFANYAYVVNSGDNTVSVIDTDSNAVVGVPIPVGLGPQGVAITPNGKYAYVSNYTDNTVSVIDIGSNLVVKTITDPSFSSPLGVAITPNGLFAYVSNNNFVVSGFYVVSVIDTSSNEVVDFVRAGGWPAGIAITPNGKYAYVANNLDGTVSVIDTSTNVTVGFPIVVGNSPFGVAITPDGRYVYVTNNGDSTVSVINADTNVATTFGGTFNSPRYAAITPDGAYMYVADAFTGSYSVSIVDTGTNADAGTVTVPSSNDCYGVAIAPNGLQAYVTNNSSSGDVYVIDVDTKTVIQTIVVGASPLGIAITPPPLPPVQPPENLNGRQIVNYLPFQKEFINTLVWGPSSSRGVQSYNVYRDDVLISEVFASGPLKYTDYAINRKLGYTYSVTSLNADQEESSAISVFIK